MCFPSTGYYCQKNSKCVLSYYFCFGKICTTPLLSHPNGFFFFSSSSPSPWQLLVLHLCRLCEPCERGVFIAGNWQSVSWYLLCSGCCFAAAPRGFNQSCAGLRSFRALWRFKLRSQGLKTRKGGNATSSSDAT